jgi:AcrR family transcriptional regulator
VTKNQRERLAAGMIASIAEHGFHETTISQISAAAGVSRRTFYAYFSSKEECYFDTYELIIHHLREASREAAAGEEEWADKVVARIRATLEFFAANPDLARYVLIAPQRAGEKPLERYQQGLDDAAAELTDGIPAAVEQPSAAVQQSMISGMLSLLAAQVEEGDGEDLPALLPDLVELFLAPYLGHEEAARAGKGAA